MTSGLHILPHLRSACAPVLSVVMSRPCCVSQGMDNVTARSLAASIPLLQNFASTKAQASTCSLRQHPTPSAHPPVSEDQWSISGTFWDFINLYEFLTLTITYQTTATVALRYAEHPSGGGDGFAKAEFLPHEDTLPLT